MNKKTKHTLQFSSPNLKEWLDIMWRVIVIAGLAGVSWGFFYLAPGVLDLFSSEPDVLYLLFITLPATVTYLVLLPAFILAIIGKSRSPRLQRVIGAVSLLAAFSAVYVLTGFSPDATCESGFFGVAYANCFDARVFGLELILIASPIFQIIAAPTLFFTILGLLDERRLHKSA